MNLVLEPPAPVLYFTDMRQTLVDACIDPADFDWYVSDLETNLPVPALGNGDLWVSGAELALALHCKGLQFVWGVFSAFTLGQGAFEVRVPPAADGNGRYWNPPEVVPQLPGARFEIVCWDSSATLLIGLPEKQAAHYLAANPQAKPLSRTWPEGAA